MNRPNIILLTTHDTGQHISPYGIQTVSTPNCERLASESVLFENSFGTAPQCSPSRASIVTGRYPHSNGTMGLTHADYAWSLHADEQPIAKLSCTPPYLFHPVINIQKETDGDNFRIPEPRRFTPAPGNARVMQA